MKNNSFFLILALLTSLFSCKKDEPAAPENASVNFIHASEDALGVDILVDNTKLIGALSFPNASGYLTVPAGTRNIKINRAGSTTTETNADLPFAVNKNYSVYAFGRSTSIVSFKVEDNLTPPAPGQAHIRFFNLNPPSPSVSLGTLVGVTFTPIFSNRPFETQATATANQGFVSVPAGVKNYVVRVGATTVKTFSDIYLAAGKIYTLSNLVGVDQIVCHN